MIFTDKQQKEHREAFIKECRQKAWSATCHAAWLAKGLDNLMLAYHELEEEYQLIPGRIKELESAIDYHTVANREKKKEFADRRTAVAAEMRAIGENIQTGEKGRTQLLQSAEASLELAIHAEKWVFKEPQGEAV
jgi:chromosome segregation ATPase